MTTTTIHFAGVNTPMLTEATEGRAILISYADVMRRPTWWQNEMLPRLQAGAFPSVILDSGAFTVISAGIRIDVADYARFAAEHAHLFDVVVGLDDIAGDLATTWGNQAVLEAHGVDAMVVFHQGESFEVLEHYLTKYDAIGVGFARKQGGRLAHDQATNARFLADFFARVREHDGVRVHGFAMTAWANRGFAFDTVDSTTWIAEYRALRNQSPDAETVERDHGMANDLAMGLDWFTDAELCELVLDSYTPELVEVSTAKGIVGMIEDYELWIETQAKGQVRTVARRFGIDRFVSKIDAIETRKCAVAAEMTVAEYTAYITEHPASCPSGKHTNFSRSLGTEGCACEGCEHGRELVTNGRAPELDPDPEPARGEDGLPILCTFCGERRELDLLEWWPDERAFQISTCCEAYQNAMIEELADCADADQQWRRGFVRWFEEQTGGADIRRPYTADGQIRLDYGLELRPITLADAKAFILKHHRHNRPPVSWRWGHAVWNGHDLVAVAMVGRPVARKIDHHQVVEVNRLCVDPELDRELVWNACSLLYGEAAREAARRGFGRIITYTLESEAGTALKACGWTAAATTAGGSWNRAGRERQDTAPTCPKVRWERELRPARPARPAREAA